MHTKIVKVWQKCCLEEYFTVTFHSLNTFQVLNRLQKRRLSPEIVTSATKYQKLDEFSNAPMRLRGGADDKPNNEKSDNEVNM